MAATAERQLFDLFADARRELYDALFDDLEQFVRATYDGNAVRFAAAVEEYLPVIIAEYGETAASVALDYFSLSRDLARIPTRHTPSLVAPVVAGLGPTIGWATQLLQAAEAEDVDPLAPAPSGESPIETTIKRLQGAAQKRVKQADAETFVANVAADPAKPAYARVPNAGACSLCRLLASGGFRFYLGIPDDVHDNCFCEFVASWDKRNPRLEGFDPDALYDEYREAMKHAGPSAKTLEKRALRDPSKITRNKDHLNDLMAGYYRLERERAGE